MIIVTAGHVDHGKTTLIQALTGTNTDRLPEEKKRGMTIDLGYAYLPLAEKTLGFIDVPGHEKFLANMLAGVGGIEYAMLVIAADEGIKPQTIEHLQILRLLQIQHIILVITKADRVSTSQIQQRLLQIQNTFPYLTTHPYFITAAYTGEGIANLKEYLTQLSSNKIQFKLTQPFRYAIDRVFSVKGAGTVVTGTAYTGKVQPEQTLYLSNGKQVRVKAIHAQNQPSQLGIAEQRLALNIATEMSKEQLKRGEWLSEYPPHLTDRVSLSITAQHPLKEYQVVHIYHSCSRCVAKLALLSCNNLIAGETALAELLLDTPLALTFNDKIIIRSGDDKQTIAGGTVLEIDSPKRYKRSVERLTYLEQLRQTQSVSQRLTLYLQHTPRSKDYILWIEQLLPEKLDQLLHSSTILSYRNWLFSTEYQKIYQQKIVHSLQSFHQTNPDQLGVSRARLARIAAINQPTELIYHFVDQLIQQRIVSQTRGWLHLADYQLSFEKEELDYWQLAQRQFTQTDQPIWVRDMANLLEVDETFMRNLLYKAGKLGYAIPIVKDRFYLTEDIHKLAQIIRQHIQQKGAISVNQLRDQLNYGRKLTVQLIEFFDRIGFLRRKGNQHFLRDDELF